jgi:hypothetical protein
VKAETALGLRGVEKLANMPAQPAEDFVGCSNFVQKSSRQMSARHGADEEGGTIAGYLPRLVFAEREELPIQPEVAQEVSNLVGVQEAL